MAGIVYKMQLIHVLLILCCILIVFRCIQTIGLQNSPLAGIGQPDEDVATLLSRIEISNASSSPKFYRYLAIAIILSYICNVILLPTIRLRPVIYITIVMFALLIAFGNYFEHHCDKYKRAYIQENIKYIRKKLKIKREKIKIVHPLGPQANRYKYLNYTDPICLQL